VWRAVGDVCRVTRETATSRPTCTWPRHLGQQQYLLATGRSPVLLAVMDLERCTHRRIFDPLSGGKLAIFSQQIRR